MLDCLPETWLACLFKTSAGLPLQVGRDWVTRPESIDEDGRAHSTASTARATSARARRAAERVASSKSAARTSNLRARYLKMAKVRGVLS